LASVASFAEPASPESGAAQAIAVSALMATNRKEKRPRMGGFSAEELGQKVPGGQLLF
jgi:hypothetical protein